MSVNLLRLVDVTVLEHLFSHIGDMPDVAVVKETVLQLIVQKCRHERGMLSGVGGFSFFQKVLGARDAKLA